MTFPRGDLDFDELLPAVWRAKAALHFTPVEVARRATALLVERPGTRVLDVGAAVGKFCIVGACAAPDALFVGIERRRHLVRVADELARRLALDNVIFTHGDATEIDWSSFDAFYLFNPFAEHLRSASSRLDATIEHDRGYFPFYVDVVRARLADARVGTRVVAYHGFGGSPPPGYVLTAEEPAGTDRLELWIKTGVTRPRGSRASGTRAGRPRTPGSDPRARRGSRRRAAPASDRG